MLNDKSILITGGTGTFGRAFIRHVRANYKPRRLIVFSRDEYKQWDMRKEFGENDHMRYFLGDVRDVERLKLALRVVDIVVHAAALKHIPFGETNPMEVIKTNVLGSQNVVMAAIDCGVKQVVALSSDKACNPINLYGMSKGCMEKLFISANTLSGAKGAQFSVVRYGNVINSRGSVIELFRQQAKTGRITITNTSMTRFFMRAEDAVQLVLFALRNMKGGEVYVPKLLSVRIEELAKVMGGPNCFLAVTGIRPGEKLHETLISIDDARNTVDLGENYAVLPGFNWYERDGLETMPPFWSYTSNENAFMDTPLIRDMVNQC
mgnify:CR=1 FL=1